MYCNSVCRSAQGDWPNKLIIISAVTLLVSSLALALLFKFSDPFANQTMLASLYADAGLGVAALVGLVVGGILKVRASRNKEEGASKPASLLSPASISEAEIFRLEGAVSSSFDDLIKKEDSAKITFYNKGKYTTFFEHQDFPGLILQLMPDFEEDYLLDNQQQAQEIIKNHPEAQHIVLPSLRILPTDQNDGEGNKLILVVRDKVKGLVPRASMEIEINRLFKQIEADEGVRAYWEERFRSAAEFICLLGVDSAQWGDIFLTTEGLAFYELSDADSTDPKNSKKGINNLLKIAPRQFESMIKSVAAKHGVEVKTKNAN